MARSILQQERSGPITQPTALVHEAAIRVLKRARCVFNDREHFFRTMVREMRRVLVDAARARKHRNHRFLDAQPPVVDASTAAFDPTDILALDEALDSLERLDPTKARVAELRLLGGLNHDEIASILSVSERTVERKWACARSHLCLALDANRQ